MALVSLSTALPWPGNSLQQTANYVLTALSTLDAAGEYQAYIGTAYQTMVISHIGFLPIASTSGVAEVRVETLTTGTPSGTLWATNTSGTSGTLVAGTWALVALTASATITAGQDYAILVKYSSGTSFAVTQLTAGGVSIPSYSGPYKATNVTGSAVKSIIGNNICIALGSSATTFYSVKGLAPVSAVIAGAFNNTSSAARAAKFQVPFPCRAIGMRWYSAGAAGNFNFGLYASDGSTEIGSTITAKTGANNAAAVGISEVMFDTSAALSINTDYYLFMEPSSATNCYLAAVTLPSADYRSAFPGGTNFYYASRASGTWTPDTTSVPNMDLLIDQFDNGAGGGGAGIAALVGRGLAA